MGGGKGKGCQGKCSKDTRTKPNRGRFEGGRPGMGGMEGVVGVKWKQLHLKYNKKLINNNPIYFYSNILRMHLSV